MKRWVLTAAAVVALAGGLAACVTPTPYQPLQAGAMPTGGYSETHIEDDRWRVSFKGNDETSRGVVETYMLYRAAELTLAQGYDWFEAAQRHTDTHTQAYALDFDGPGWGPWGFRRGFWGVWGDPFWAQDVDYEALQRYDASVEIVMHHGPKPGGDDHAFDAHQVIANLNGKIVRPGAN